MELPPSPPLPPASSPPPPGPSSVPAGASSAPVGVWDAQRRRDRLIGLLIVAVAFAACIVLTIWAKEKSEPEQSVPPGPPTVEGVVGYPSEVDPIESLKAARKLTRRSALRGFVLDGVSPNGTIDLADAANRARYSFQSEPGQGPQPPREPGTLPKRITCGKQNVILRNGGLVAEPDQADYPCGSGGVEALPEPQCSTRELWRLARRRRIPNDRSAHIEYYRSKAGPAWRFEISGTEHRFTVYGDCKRELTGLEAHGSVP